MRFEVTTHADPDGRVVLKLGQRLMAFGLTDHYRQIFSLTRLAEAIKIHADETASLAAV